MKNALIVAVVGGFLPQFEKNDVNILKALGFKIHYGANFDIPVYSFDREALESEGIVLHKIGIRKSPLKLIANIKALRAIRNIIKTENIDLIHCHNPMGGVCARLATFGLGKKRPYVLYTAHGFHFYKGAPLLNWIFYFTAEWILAGLTDGVITINDEDYKRAKRLPLRRPGNAFVIHSVGVNDDRFKPQKDNYDIVRKELGIPENAFHMVTAAELNNNKNQKVIINAIKKLGADNVYFSICGSGPNEESLKSLISELGLANRVKLLGYRNDMERILSGADLFTFSSIREGLGVAAVEAMLCGVPVICSDNRGTREYAKDGINAKVCQNGSEEEFADGIEWFLNNPKKRSEMGARARDSVREFSISNVGRTMKDIYSNILTELRS